VPTFVDRQKDMVTYDTKIQTMRDRVAIRIVGKLTDTQVIDTISLTPPLGTFGIKAWDWKPALRKHHWVCDNQYNIFDMKDMRYLLKCLLIQKHIDTGRWLMI